MKQNLILYKGQILTLIVVCVLFIEPLRVSAQEESNTGKYKLEMSFLKEDSINKVKAVITSSDTSGTSKIKDVEVKFYAKKSFGLLPLGEEGATTDDNGEVTIDFPADLPGDEQGNVQVLARVEDNDDLGELEATGDTKWGIPPTKDLSFQKRALWATGANAPLPLVISITAMVAGVWGVIAYIVLLLFKIPKS
nr:hypothetical protein [Bacteroidota bacterium]